MTRRFLGALCGATLVLAAGPRLAVAAEFKSIDQCKPGTQVNDRKNRAGTITRVSNGMCYVRFAGSDKEENFLHWMLRPAGSSTVTSDKLVNGAYKDKNGKAGRYNLDAKTGKIVFESGTLKGANAKLFNGPRIGLNMDGKSVYSVTCDLQKKK